MKLRALMHTLFSRFLILCVLIIYIPLLLIVMIMPLSWVRKSGMVYYFVYWFYWLALKSSLLKITYEGVENIPDEPLIFVANHQSSLDIPLVGLLVKGNPHIWLAKQELTESILLRFILPRLSVLVEPTLPTSAMRSLVNLLKTVEKDHQHIMIFPEGSRFTDGKVHKFYGGFALLAKKTGRKVIPVHIYDAYKVYPPESFLIHNHPIHVVVGKPFELQPDESDKAFTERVYKWFVTDK